MKRKQTIDPNKVEKKVKPKKATTNRTGSSLLKFAGPTLGISIFALLAVSFLQFYLIIQVPSDSRISRYLDTTLTSYAELVRLSASKNSVALQVAAQDIKLRQALKSKNIQEIKDLEARLLASYEKTVGVRILLPNLIKTDTKSKPVITNVTLDLIRRAAKGEVLSPEVIGLGTPEQYIAITQPIIEGEQLIGVILAGFETSVINDALTRIQSVPGYLELRQIFGKSVHVLGAHGSKSLKVGEPLGSSSLPGTSWQLAYWPSGDEDFSTYGDTLIFWGAITFMLLMIAALGFYGYYRLGKTVRLDTARLLKIILNAHSPHFAIPKGAFHLQIISDLAFNLSRAGIIIADNVSEQGFQVTQKSDKDEAGEMEEADDQFVENPFASPLLEEDALDLQIMEDDEAFEIPESIFREYDIRGIVNETLTPEIVYEIGRAIGSEAFERGEQKIIVARDGRLSGPELLDALKTGLMASGRDVIDIGEVPTPVLYFASHHLGVYSGVMVTGSHNPANYNGLKIVLAGDTLCGPEIHKLYKRVVSTELLSGEGHEERKDVVPAYMKAITGDVALAQPLKVVIDCGNGIAAKVAPRLYQALGCEVVGIFCKIDGSFPNHDPDPSKEENLKELADMVKSEQADLGIAFDGDGDRIGVIDSNGNIIWPDTQLMLFSMDMLSRNPGADVIFDVNCSKHLSSTIRGNGGRPIMWKVGHSNIKEKMRETDALLAGERSGHIYFKERWFGFDDGLYAGARLLEILAADFRKSTEVFDVFPKTVSTTEMHVAMSDTEKKPFMEKFTLAADFKSGNVTTIDGVRVDFADGWGLVRASNTSPHIAMRFEADNEEALKKIQARFRTVLIKVKADLQLPF